MPGVATQRLDGSATDLLFSNLDIPTMSGDYETTKIVSSAKPQVGNTSSKNDNRRNNGTNGKNFIRKSGSPCPTEEGTSVPVSPDTPKTSVESDATAADIKATKSDDTMDSDEPTQPPEIRKDLQNMTFAGFMKPNRGRIVSLDRGRQRLQNGQDAFCDNPSSAHQASTDDERLSTRHSFRDSGYTAAADDDNAHDSSDDDSSYFATDLPSPKSSHAFVFSGTGSVNRGQQLYPSQSSSVAARESDASLSLSDESDDGFLTNQHMNVRVSPMIASKGNVADMLLYPQRITRMHSVSSLVSSGSSEDDSDHIVHQTSNGSVSSAGTRSDVTAGSDFAMRNKLIDGTGAIVNIPSLDSASGRTSPVTMHQQPPFFGDPEQAVAPPQSAAMPQALNMTQEQLANWMSPYNAVPAAASAAPVPNKPMLGGQFSQQYQNQQPRQPYFGNLIPQAGLGYRNTSENTSGTLPFVYSEDDDTDESQQRVPAVALAGGQPYNASPNQSFQGKSNGNDDITGNGTEGAAQERPPRPQSGQAFDQRQQSKSSYNDDGGSGQGKGDSHITVNADGSKTFKLYWRRWVMLMYMSILNLLSDWTCYSVAPIAILTQEAFGDIDPERLVVIFLGANAVASACEPIILARLGLKRTVLFGALLLMIGSIVKSGGMPPIIPSSLVKGHDEWRLYLGFFLVGLSQPLYQCTPALLSASWFPEQERTMATGVALNANQLGIGFAFIFGTLLVSESDDIPSYFGLLSIISTLVFFGTLFQFDDAPPTPPSDTARVMRGTLTVKLPSINSIVQSVQVATTASERFETPSNGARAAAPSPAPAGESTNKPKLSSARRRAKAGRSKAVPPSSALSYGSTNDAMSQIKRIRDEAKGAAGVPPSHMMPGRVGPSDGAPGQEDTDQLQQPPSYDDGQQPGDQRPPAQQLEGHYPNMPSIPPQGQQSSPYPPASPMQQMGAFPHPHYQYPYWDPRFQEQMRQQQMYYQQQYMQYQQFQQPPQPYYYNMPYPPHLEGYEDPHRALPSIPGMDDGVEPLVTFTPHHLDIEIRDDQVIRSIQACFSRPGFIHSLVAFTVSGIVINTLSTFMDYLVRLNGAPRAYTGIVGGTFQFVIMISSLIVGKQTDNTRAYYSVIIGMLVLGAFGLAECGVSLDSDRGSELRWALVIVAGLVGPLQPVSTELGVDVVYPLSENTVLVIQQLFSNLLSAIFIPCFKAMKDIGTSEVEDTEMYEHPEYTFSFYLLIVLHAAATVFFATFNGRYLRYEHELQKKADEEKKHKESVGAEYPSETQPLMSGQVI